MKNAKFFFVILTIFICVFIFTDTRLNVSAESQNPSQSTDYLSYESVELYIKTDAGNQQIKSIINKSLKKYFICYNIDDVLIGKPFNAACYYEKKHKVTMNASKSIFCGLYYNNELIGFLRFYINNDKTAPYCYECILLSSEIIQRANENIVLFFTSSSDKYTIQAGGATEKYVMTDNGNIKLISAAHRVDEHPFEDFFERRNLPAIKFTQFPSSAYIPLKINDGVSKIDINYTADNTCHITNGNGKYLTRSKNGYILTDRIENDNSQLFYIINLDNKKKAIVNLKSNKKVKLKGETEFYIFQTNCGEEYAEYINGGIVTAIINCNGYALAYINNKVYAAEYNDYYLTSESQTWFIEKI